MLQDRCFDSRACSSGCLDDDEAADGTKKEDKVAHLNNMLEYIAQFVPHFLTYELVHESTSMKSVWQIIRQYYNIQQSEAHFLKLSYIKWEGRDKERPEHLYRRILSHLTDNLLKADGGLKHNNQTPTADESLSPTVERLAVHRWLELIDPRLPMLVARTFATDLLTKTLKDIQPLIANAMDSLLEQLNNEDLQLVATSKIQALQIDESDEEIQIAQVTSRSKFQSRFPQRPYPVNRSIPRSRQSDQKPRLQCLLCQGWGRPSVGHDMATCKYISEGQKQAMARRPSKSFRVDTRDDACDEVEYEEQE
jgi:hypothetical protein